MTDTTNHPTWASREAARPDEPLVRPILFSGEMVRALLAGAKTETRRVIAPKCRRPTQEGYDWHMGEQEDGSRWPYWQDYVTGEPAPIMVCCPYDVKRLWVRETWAHDAESVYYRADRIHENTGLRWRPSIHMPRWASRIVLDVTSVRVERLHEITEEGSKAEGFCPEYRGLVAPVRPARDVFMRAWNKINGKRPGRAWADNPWVWVVRFKTFVPPSQWAIEGDL